MSPLRHLHCPEVLAGPLSVSRPQRPPEAEAANVTRGWDLRINDGMMADVIRTGGEVRASISARPHHLPADMAWIEWIV